MVSTWIVYCKKTIIQGFQIFYGRWQRLGNSTEILKLEIPLDHLTNFGSTVNGKAQITNPLIWVWILRISNPMNPFSKRIHQIKNPDFDLLKGMQNPFSDQKFFFGSTERNTPFQNMVNLSLFGCHVIDQAYVCVYSFSGWRRGVSGIQSNTVLTSFHLTSMIAKLHKERKSIHPRKLGNHVTVHSPPSVRTTGEPTFNFTLSSYRQQFGSPGGI